ncbi:MAG: type I DNA topoisomerase [Pseudomonadota bacterium]
MGKSLVIVESPSKARTIKRYLGSGFEVKATVGHVKDLPQRELGVDVDDDFALKYQVIRGKGKILQGIRDAAEGCDKVFIGADPDREGEAIAWHVAQELKTGEGAPEIFRVLFHEITRRGVEKAMASPGRLNENRYESQKARRALDRLVGYEISPLLWKKVKRGLSAGRVQSVAVRLVTDREREIRAFDSVEYWTIKASLSSGAPPQFEAQLVEIDGKKAEITRESEATPVVEALRAASFSVDTVAAKTRSRHAPPPFITSRLQQEAHRFFRFSAKRTMALAQQLYEGIELGEEGPTGLITYMRTDSTRVAAEVLEEARAYIGATFGEQFLPEKPNFYKNRKSAQDAHEAIRPTSSDWSPARIKAHLDTDQLKLYTLIWKRFIGSQMNPALYDVTTLDIVAAERFRLRTSGSVLRFTGYREVYMEREDENETANGDSKELPILVDGQALERHGVEGIQSFTQPPPRFTEATLIKMLEEKGIGRPSTYAMILSTIQERKYVDRDQGKFFPTELGFAVTDLLQESFPDIVDVRFTATMEEELDRVEDGELAGKVLMQQFWTGFNGALVKARVDMKDLKRAPIPTDIVCERCDSGMVIKFGRNGEFLACSNFPECRNTMNFKRDPKGTIEPIKQVETGVKCPEHDQELIMRNGRFGPFLACPEFPKCTHTAPVPTDLKCARAGCDGELVERKSKKGRTFYRCTKSPECEFVMFGVPLKRPCPACGNPYLQESRGRAKVTSCPNPACDFRES